MEYDKLINMDINIVVSMINMKLRDEFENLEDYCSFNDYEIDRMSDFLKKNGYIYIEENNSIKKM